MIEATVIFPHQLFENHPALKNERPVFLIEDQIFFRDFNYRTRFHKKKLMFHRASMKAYEKRLADKGYQVTYIDWKKSPSMEYLFKPLQKNKIEMIHLCDPVDYMLEKRLHHFTSEAGIKTRFYETPGFLTSLDQIEDFFAKKKGYSQTSFYIARRKELGILVEDGKPPGGKWSFDPKNRKPIPDDQPIPEIPRIKSGKTVKEAADYVSERFADHPGSLEDFFYPVTHKEARKWLRDFLKNRLELFGDYEDAMKQGKNFLFHSVLSPLINSGLLTPKEVIDETLDFADDHDIPMNSLEGFIRQLAGWREFMRAIYELEGVNLRNSNFFEHDNPLPDSFYNASTGIEPVDEVLSRVIETGYAHHIERLMILGNFMLLCEINPEEIYRWFMEMFIDSYDWVMVPNVYGMSQYSSGGLITTKPYISSSNYVLKMSNHEKGDWCEIWDGLYWRFIQKNRKKFEKIPRMKVMTSMLGRMSEEKLKERIGNANNFLKNISEHQLS